MKMFYLLKKIILIAEKYCVFFRVQVAGKFKSNINYREQKTENVNFSKNVYGWK